jgi:hypothetical protein
VSNIIDQARFQVLTAAGVKMAVFWYAAPCSLVDIDRRFRGTRQVVSTSETSVSFQNTAIFIIDQHQKHLEYEYRRVTRRLLNFKLAAVRS